MSPISLKYIPKFIFVVTNSLLNYDSFFLKSNWNKKSFDETLSIIQFIKMNRVEC